MWVAGFIYALKCGLILNVLYLMYMLLLHKNNRFGLKRAILLGLIITALILPLVEVHTTNESVAQIPVINEIEAVVEEGTNDYQPVYPSKIGNKVYPTRVKEKVSWTQPVVFFYWGGVGLALSIFLIQFLRVVYFVSTGQTKNASGPMVVIHPSVKYPFSFLKWTFFPQNIDYDDETWQLINAHEQSHLRHWHSLDMLMVHLVQIFLWFTPASYLLLKSIKDNHEHQVDQEVLKEFDLTKYTQALLAVSFESGSFRLGNPFAHQSGLAKRIKHMTAKRSPIYKSVMAICILLTTSSFIFFHTSVYGQKVVGRDSALVITAVPFSQPKSVAITDRDRVPERFLRVMDKLKALNPHKQYLFEIQLFFQPSKHPDQKIVFFDKLTKEENRHVPISKIATQFLNHKGEVSTEIVHSYTGIISELEIRIIANEGYTPDKRHFNFDDTYYTQDQLSESPGMLRDKEDLIQMVTLGIEIPEGLNEQDIPETFDYNVYFNEEGYPLKFTLSKDQKHNNEALYKLEGQVYKNLREKAFFFSWRPGKIDGRPVKSKVVISIPSTYF